MKNQALFALLAAVLAPLSVAAFTPQAYAKPVYVGVDGGNIAVSGYDAVSYFEGDGVPVKGDAAFAVEHDGAVYHFASADHAAKFRADPAAFMPRYGGHCAWAMRSEEHTSELQSLMRNSYAGFCLKKKKLNKNKE